jgi:hypothetical protein
MISHRGFTGLRRVGTKGYQGWQYTGEVVPGNGDWLFLYPDRLAGRAEIWEV